MHCKVSSNEPPKPRVNRHQIVKEMLLLRDRMPAQRNIKYHGSGDSIQRGRPIKDRITRARSALYKNLKNHWDDVIIGREFIVPRFSKK